jgi:hypothetical protein
LIVNSKYNSKSRQCGKNCHNVDGVNHLAFVFMASDKVVFDLFASTFDLKQNSTKAMTIAKPNPATCIKKLASLENRAGANLIKVLGAYFGA